MPLASCWMCKGRNFGNLNHVVARIRNGNCIFTSHSWASMSSRQEHAGCARKPTLSSLAFGGNDTGECGRKDRRVGGTFEGTRFPAGLRTRRVSLVACGVLKGALRVS